MQRVSLVRRTLLFVASLLIIANCLQFETEGHASRDTKQGSNTNEYRNDAFQLVFQYQAGLQPEEWDVPEEMTDPARIRYQIRLKTARDEYVTTISIFQKVASLEDWLRETQEGNIRDGFLNLEQARVVVNGKQAYWWSTPDGHDYPGISLALQGDRYLYYISFPAESALEEVRALIHSLTILSSQGPNELPLGIPSRSETLSNERVPTNDQASNSPLRAALEHPNGWLYPAGSSNYQYLSWLCYNSAFSGYHLAQDMANPQGDPVYAVDSGDVIYSSSCVGGYGGPSGGTCGGALVIRHRAKDGTWFTALYGHLNSPHPIGHVYFGDVIGYSNNWNPPHVHFGVRPGYDVPDTDPYRGYTSSTNVLYGFTKPANWTNACGTGTGFLETYYACRNGSSVDFRPNNNAPVHPNGTLVKSSTDGTVYLTRNGQKQGIVSAAVLRNLYPNGGFDFKDVITIAQDEWNSYPTGSVITSQLSSNGRTHAEGRLIRRSTGGEISIVTDNGMRRPFVSSGVFLNLGYLFCNAVDATDANYDSYPLGAPVTGTGGGSSCTYSISPTSQSFSSNGGSGSISVSASAGNCSWSVSGVPSWVTITSGSSGTGGGTVAYTVTSNSGAARSATITIAGQAFSISQLAGTTPPPGSNDECSGASVIAATPYTNTQDANAATQSGSDPTTCAGGGAHSLWYRFTPSSSGTITVDTFNSTYDTALAAYTGSCGSLSRIACNDDSASTLQSQLSFSANAGTSYFFVVTSFGATAGSLTLHVSFSGGSSCSFTINPPSGSFSSNGGSGSISVSASAGNCSWSVSGVPSWVTITSGSSGTGGGTVAYTVASNSGAARSATMTIAGQAFSISQSAGTTPPPGSNDECSGASVIAATPYTNTQDANAATQSGSDPTTCAGGGAHSLWYRFTPSSSGTITVDTFNSTYDTALAAYTGSCGSLSRIACNDDSASTLQSQLSFSANAGTSYFFVVTSFGATAGSLTLHVSFSGGSSCSFTINPPSGSFSSNGGSGSISVSASAGNCSWSVSGVPSWVTITSGSSGTGGGTVAYTVASNSGAARSATMTIAGQAFSISQSAGTTPPPGSNDECSGASVIAATPYTNTQDANAATQSGSDPTTCAGGGAHSLWYRFTPSSSGTITVDTFNSTYDTALAAYTGSCGSLSRIACNDDSASTLQSQLSFSANAGTSYFFVVTSFGATAGSLTLHVSFSGGSSCSFTINPPSGSFSSNGGSGSISVSASAGNCSWSVSGVPSWVTITSGSSGTGGGTVAYTVASNSGAARSATMTIAGQAFSISQSAGTTPPPGSNDECSGASVIAATPYTNTQDANAATQSGSDPTTCAGGGAHSLWYRFTPSSSGTITVDTFNSTYDTALAAYTGSCGSLSRIACNDDSASTLQSQLSFSANAGTSYFFVVTSFGATAGSLTLHVSFSGGSTARRTVFLIHGLRQSASDMSALLGTLLDSTYGIDHSRFGIDALFDYSSCANNSGCDATLCTIQNMARSLATYINNRNPQGDIILVGYSLGGLVARDMILNNYNNVFANRRVAALITLGTPNVGYPYIDADNLAACPNLIQQMRSDYRERQSENLVVESQYLFDLNNRWGSSSFPGQPGLWLAASGTSCNDPTRLPASGPGCPDSNPRSDGVVCEQSSSFRLNVQGHLPTSLFADPDHLYSHTGGFWSFTALCSGSGFQPLFNPIASGTLVRAIKELINGL